MKTYRESKFQNGLTLISSYDPNEEVATISASFFAGSRFELHGQSGWAHLLEHMLLKGTPSRPSAIAVGIVADRRGALLNATTSVEFLNVYTQVAREYAGEMCTLLADVIAHPLLDAATLENEKKVVLEEIQQMQDNRARRCYTKSMSLVFEGHPLSQRPLGDVATVTAANTEGLRIYHDQYLRPERAVLISVGGVSHDEFTNLADEHVAHLWHGETTVKREETKLPVAHHGVSFVNDAGAQTNLFFNFLLPPLSIRELTALDLIANVLSYGKTGVLLEELRHKRGLVYSVGAEVISYREATLLLITTRTSKPQETAQLVPQLVENLEKVFTRELFGEYIEQYRGMTLRLLNSQSFEQGFLQSYWALTGALVTPAQALAVLGELTYENVLAASKKYLSRDNLFVTVFGEKEFPLDL